MGSHQFEWVLDGQFFETFGDEDITAGQLHAVMDLEIQERMMVLNFKISGTLVLPCDRCLADLNMPVLVNESYFIKIGQEWLEESEQVLIIPESEYQIDVSELLHDYVILSFPMKKVHGTDSKGDSLCDKEAIRMLEKLNRDKKEDPRWDALKNINLDNNI